MAEQKTMILSGVAQNQYSSFEKAKDDGVRGRLLFARVTGQTSGYDASGDLCVNDKDAGSGCSKTYVFMGKKCYGTFPQLPLELINAIGINVDEAQEGVITSLTNYYTSQDIVGILKEIKQKQNVYEVASSGKTVVVTSAQSGDDKSGYNTLFNVEVNNDNKTIITDDNGLLSVATSAISAITKVELDTNSKDVAFVTVEKIEGTENSAVTLGLSGGSNGQVIKKSGDTYVWDYESSTEIASGAHSGVVVEVTVDPTTNEKTYSIGGDFHILRTQSGEGSAVSTSYKLMVKNGTDYVQAGDEIKLLNDNYLKDVEIVSADPESRFAGSGFLYTWVIKTQEDIVDTKTTFVPLSDLDTYVGGSGITIVDDTLNTINVLLSTDENNILGFDSASGLIATAITSISANGTELEVVSNGVDLGALVSSITTTYNGVANEEVFSGSVSDEGVLNVYLNLSADTIPFDSSNIKEIIPSISGDDVQEVIEQIVDQLGESTDGILTISANGYVYEYNPSASTEINIRTLTSLTIGNEAFEIGMNNEGISGSIDTISASAITFNYTGAENTGWTLVHSADTTADDTLNSIIDELALINDNSISGLSAISASTDESGNTEISLILNPSNITSQGDGIIESNDGAVAIEKDIKNGPTNAVKMSQSPENGLFVYIEIVGDDTDDDDEVAMSYSTLNEGTGWEFGVHADKS